MRTCKLRDFVSYVKLRPCFNLLACESDTMMGEEQNREKGEMELDGPGWVGRREIYSPVPPPST